MNNVLDRGAEAILYLEDGKLVKERIKKSYRIETIDLRLRKTRTRREAKVLEKGFSFVPRLHDVDDEAMKITMDYVDGRLLRDTLEKLDAGELDQLMMAIGKQVAFLHEKDVMHGDLTTSNLILKDGNVFFIDFGLSFSSTREEDRAVDLYLLKQALGSTHHAVAERCFQKVLEGYRTYAKADGVLKCLQKVEQRGRYKRKMLVE